MSFRICNFRLSKRSACYCQISKWSPRISSIGFHRIHGIILNVIWNCHFLGFFRSEFSSTKSSGFAFHSDSKYIVVITASAGGQTSGLCHSFRAHSITYLDFLAIQTTSLMIPPLQHFVQVPMQYGSSHSIFNRACTHTNHPLCVFLWP